MSKFCQTIFLMLFVLLPSMASANEAHTVVIAEGDGTTNVFGPKFLWDHEHNADLQGLQLVPGTIFFKLTDGSATLQDNGTDGELVKSNYGNGFVDYNTGLYYLILANPPAQNVNVTATFDMKKDSRSKEL
ncbi:MAG: hypothetical protein Q8K75_08610 [Chlamydiales bacterium]|nr:hypothetical protein [Chlamydiales bacterium]